MDGDVGTLVHRWVCNQEVHAIIVLGLMCIGAWVVLAWMLQMMYVFLCPMLIIACAISVMPTWRRAFIDDVYPKYSELVRNLIQHSFVTARGHNGTQQMADMHF